MPIYNAAAYLPMCLSSLTHQTHTNLEIILVDDGSTDQSCVIAQAFADVDSRVRYICQERGGQGKARNLGLTLATGDYIVFVDADDYIDTQFLAKHLPYMTNLVDMVQSGFHHVDSDGQRLSVKPVRFTHQFTSPWARMYTRDFLLRNSLQFPEGCIYEDVLFSLQLWARRPNICTIPYCGYYYRKNPISTTAHRNRKAEQYLYHQIWQTPSPIWLKIWTSLRLFFHFMKQQH